jgi:NADH-quinone oxidoreductase subunit I
MNGQQEELTFSRYFKNIYDGVISTLKGMKITMSYNFRPSACVEYPEEREVIPKRVRARLFNNVDDCIACNQCATACPVDCIYIAATKRSKDAPVKKTSGGTPIRLDLKQYTIDTALCCYCGLCTSVCPTGCLTHSNDFEYTQYDCNDMKYDYLSDDVRAWKERVVGKQEVPAASEE